MKFEWLEGVSKNLGGGKPTNFFWHSLKPFQLQFQFHSKIKKLAQNLAQKIGSKIGVEIVAKFAEIAVKIVMQG